MSVAIQCQDFNCPIFLNGTSGEMFDRDSSKNFVSILRKGFVDFWKSETMTLGLPLDEAFLSLRETFNECSVPDWDGYGARPVCVDAFAEARRLIELLPSSLKMPEISAEPTGEIALEWRKGKDRTFVISFGGKQKITYAGLFGGNKTHGTEYFEDSMPTNILNNIRRVYS
jgi:hypothetical protein